MASFPRKEPVRPRDAETSALSFLSTAATPAPLRDTETSPPPLPPARSSDASPRPSSTLPELLESLEDLRRSLTSDQLSQFSPLLEDLRRSLSRPPALSLRKKTLQRLEMDAGREEEYNRWIESEGNVWADLKQGMIDEVRPAKQWSETPAAVEKRSSFHCVDGHYILNPESTSKYRKRLAVYAFQTTDPCQFSKSWGVSSVGRGDWVIAAEGGDLYGITNELFEQTYEPIAGMPNRYQKKGFVYAEQMLFPFIARDKNATQEGKSMDYLVQSVTGEQWSMSADLFNKTYEPAILSRHTRMLNGLLLFSCEDDGSTVGDDEVTLEVTNYLREIDSLSFDAFKLATLSDGRPLTAISGDIFRRQHYFQPMDMDPQTFFAFINEVENTYQGNPYHNSTHATDVTQSTFYLMTHSALDENLDVPAKVTLLISAMVHDVGHPGTNNIFQVKTKTSIALCYNDRSVLENFHCATAFHIMRKESYNIIPDTSPHYTLFRTFLIELVLSTDLALHKQYLTKYGELIDSLPQSSPSFSLLTSSNWPKETDSQLLIMTSVIKSSDDAHIRWSSLVNDESFQQAKEEELLGLPSSFDPQAMAELKFCQSQIGFIRFLVKPLVQDMCTLLGFPDVLERIDATLDYWQKRQNKCVCDERS